MQNLHCQKKKKIAPFSCPNFKEKNHYRFWRKKFPLQSKKCMERVEIYLYRC